MESNIHSLAVQMAGLAFSVGLLTHFIKAQQVKIKVAHFITFIFVIGISALFAISDANAGVIQRVLYCGSFLWLVFYYNQTSSKN